MRQRRLDQTDGAHQVDVEAGAPVLRAVGDGERADVGDDAVDAAEGVGAGVHPIRQRRRVTHVDRGADRGDTVGGQLRLRRRDRVRGARAERDRRALGEQTLDDGPADAAGAAGDEEALARQTEFHGVPSLSAISS